MSEVLQGSEEAGTEVAVETEEKTQSDTKTKKSVKNTGNLIADVAAEVETLTKTKALNLAASLSENIESNYFKLGGVLKVISDNGWYEGYDSFDSFVGERFGFASRKAKYLMQIYVDLVSKQIPWEKVAHLGWTKLKDLSPIITTENLDEWVKKAEALTVLELQALIKGGGEGGTSTTDKTTDDIVVLKYKFKQDQAETVQHALAKAKGEVGTEFDTVALENICSLYLSGNMGTITSSMDAESVVKSLGWEQTLVIFDKLFPQINLTVDAQAA
jgi:hypothetical protein